MKSIHIRATVAEEIATARRLMRARRLDAAMQHLRKAHVLGQQLVGPHALVHWLMLRVAVARRDTRAAVGQVLRIVLGALGNIVGVLPTGNTGASDVGMFQRMPIPPDLARLIDGASDV